MKKRVQFSGLIFSILVVLLLGVNYTTKESYAVDQTVLAQNESKPVTVVEVDSSLIKPHYRIISFDGGGIRGVLSCKLLSMLIESVPELLSDIHLYAGTSTGSIISVGLASGIDINQLLELYLQNGASIFDPYPALFKAERGLATPKYDRKLLITLLQKTFSADATLKSLQTDVVVPSIMLNDNGRWRPKVFSSFPGSGDEDELVVDVALRSSAAPVYYSTYQGYIDGGLMANNPSMMALANALDPALGNVNIEDVRILSIGTGTPLHSIIDEKAWGAAEWLNPLGEPAVPLLALLLDGVSAVSHYQSSHILKDKYKRIDLALDKGFPMDDWKDAEYLVLMAEKYRSDNPEEWQAIIDWVVTEFMGGHKKLPLKVKIN